MTKQIEIGSTITAKKPTKNIIRGVLYKIVARQMAFPYFIVRCPYDGARYYIHKNNIKVMT